MTPLCFILDCWFDRIRVIIGLYLKIAIKLERKSLLLYIFDLTLLNLWFVFVWQVLISAVSFQAMG